MIDQVIWARAIVPFLVYDWSYILTFCLLFPPITERPCGVKIAPRPRKKSSKRNGFSDFICNFALSLDFLFLFATRRYVEFFDMARPWAAFVAQDIKSIINYSAAE